MTPERAEEASRGRLRWWMLPAGIGALVLVAGGVVVGLFLVRDDPGAKPVSERVEEVGGTSTTTAGEEEPYRPPAGVYVLEGEGREAISFPPVSQDDGTPMPASVEHLAEGCWRFRIDYNEAHWQDWVLCPADEGLVETEGQTWQRWDFGATEVTNLSTFLCEPPNPAFVFGAEPGEMWERACEGTNDQVEGATESSGTMTYLGPDTLTIGGEPVAALRFRREHTFTGAQTGEEQAVFWVAEADAMPLRGERSVRIESDSPIGSVTYTEEGVWQLTSLTPEG